MDAEIPAKDLTVNQAGFNSLVDICFHMLTGLVSALARCNGDIKRVLRTIKRHQSMWGHEMVPNNKVTNSKHVYTHTGKNLSQ